MATTLICIKGRREELETKIETGKVIYIGRRICMGGWNLKGSKWANPFRVGEEVPNGELAVYRYWLYLLEERKDLMEAAAIELKGQTLGCWCRQKGNEPCHGDVLLFHATGMMPPVLKEILERNLSEDETEKEVRKLKGTTIIATPRPRVPSKSKPRFQLDAVQGMLYGSALGDALGVPYEFAQEKREFTGKLEHIAIRTNRFHETKYFSLGQYSDDTEMMLALAFSILESSGYHQENALKSYLKWANAGTKSMGRNTRDLLQGIKTVKGFVNRYNKQFATDEAMENSQSNGALMRCCPLACLREDEYIDDCQLTNPSSIAIDAERVFITGLRGALAQKSQKDVWDRMAKVAETEPVRKLFREIEIGKSRIIADTATLKIKGWVLSSLYCALWCFYQILPTAKEPYEESMRWVIQHKGSDTDTNAAITGALIGAAIGWDRMLDEKQTMENYEVMLGWPYRKGDFMRPKEYWPDVLEAVAKGLTALSGV
jgi:ADP-ribosylglycohydrolase